MKQSAIQRKAPLRPKRSPRKCRECGERYMPMSTTQTACSPRCALALAPKLREQKRRADEREKKAARRAAREKIKTRSEHLREAQQAFNAMIRERDRDLPCISCGRHHEGQYHAGHYRTVGANPELRFEPLNAHKQCAPCNNHKSGDIVNYRINLVQKVGADKVAWLEGPHAPKKYSVQEIIGMKEFFRWATRWLIKQRGGK